MHEPEPVDAPLWVACLCAAWCGTCGDYRAVFDMVARESAPAARFLWIDIEDAADALGKSVFEKFPFPPGMRAVSNDPFELLLNNTWRSTLSVTGVDGIPAMGNAGNTLRPYTSLKLSFRLPPTGDPAAAAAAVKKIVETDPPQGAPERAACSKHSAIVRIAASARRRCAVFRASNEKGRRKCDGLPRHRKISADHV